MSDKVRTIARKHTGELIKAFRRSAELTQRQVADRLLVSESLLGAYERAERIPSRTFLTDADRVLNACGALASCADLMDTEKYRPHYSDWARREAEALAFYAYETLLVPGLLQSERYMRAIYRMRVPAWDEEYIERQVRARLDRQTLLSRDPLPVVGYVVEQVVIERPMGGVDLHRETLRHVLECIRTMPHVTVQVMPTRAEQHATLSGAMQLLTMPSGRALVYADRQLRGKLLSDPDDVAPLMARFSTLRAQAMSPSDSADLIERTASEL